MLKVLVLGSAAGGGSPQWNCNSHVSKLVRQGLDGTTPRTQSSIAVTSNNKEWLGNNQLFIQDMNSNTPVELL